MPRLEYEHWRSSGHQQDHMNDVIIGDVGLRTIFLEKMQEFFMGETGTIGKLYNGLIDAKLNEIVAVRGGRHAFTVEDQDRLIRHGQFKYTNGGSNELLIQHIGGRRIFGRFNGSKKIELANETIGDSAKELAGGDQAAAREIAGHICVATVLWGIMVDHGFSQPAFSSDAGAPYHRCLPCLAFDAVMSLAPIIGPRHSSDAKSGLALYSSDGMNLVGAISLEQPPLAV